MENIYLNLFFFKKKNLVACGMFVVSLLGLARLGPTQGRGPLTSKRAPHLKKGYGAAGLGSHTKTGFFPYKYANGSEVCRPRSNWF